MLETTTVVAFVLDIFLFAKVSVAFLRLYRNISIHPLWYVREIIKHNRKL